MWTVSESRLISKPVKNFLFIIFGNGVRWILSFIVTVYLARVLGASGFGKVSFAFSLFAYGVLLSDLGLTVLGTREVARRKEDIESTVSGILSLRSILALVSFVLLLLFSLFGPLQKDTKLVLTIYSFSIFFYAFYLDWFFRGKERMANISIASVITQVIYVFLVILFVTEPGDIMRVPFLWFMGIGAGVIFLIFVFFAGRNRFRFNPDFSLLKLSIPMGIAAIMNHVYFHFDLVTIGFIRGESEVGLYNASFKLITFLLSVDTAFAWVYFPMVSRFFSESKEKFKTLVFTGTRLVSIFAIPLAFGGMVLGERIINLIYGERFLEAVDAFRILIWAIPLTSIQTIFAFGLIGCDREKKYSLGMVIGTLLNIVMNLVLIPFMGIKGAAIATIISEIAMLCVMFLWFKDILFVPLHRYILKPIVATAVMLILMILVWKIPVVYVIISSVCVYSVVIWLLKGITKDDIRLLRGGYGAIGRNH
jgi:O-antigen/teichoic acid export membrane protein